MKASNKQRVIKDYEKLNEKILGQIKLVYPMGFSGHLIEFTGIDGQKRKGLPFETEDKYYLIRMTVEKAINVIANDDDYDVSGNLKQKVKAKLEDKHEDVDFLDEFNSNDDNDLGNDDDLEFDELEDGPDSEFEHNDD